MSDNKIKQFFDTANAVMSSAVTAGTLLSKPELIETRLKICSSCEEFDGTKCKKCGCYMKAKHRLSASGCPLKKW